MNATSRLSRVVAVVVLGWWVTTPAVCEAFLFSGVSVSVSSHCRAGMTHAQADADDAEASRPIESASQHPCHGAPPETGSQPAESSSSSKAPDSSRTCCRGVELGKPSQLDDDGMKAPELPTAVIGQPAWTTELDFLPERLPVIGVASDELRSPYRRLNRPLLN